MTSRYHRLNALQWEGLCLNRMFANPPARAEIGVRLPSSLTAVRYLPPLLP